MNIFIAKVEEGLANLTSEESWHCVKVLRNKIGDQIKLIDGEGNFYLGELSVVNEKKCQAKILKGPEQQNRHPYHLHLVIAPTKQIDRIEWMIEKAVEIGIDEISFVICKNSERSVIKSERIRKIVESAVKQSLQAFIPKVNEAQSFEEIISNNEAEQNLIAHCYSSEKQILKNIHFKNKRSKILIGPEGDFTPAEVEAALKKGYVGISLGDNRLRTETAGLYICQAASLLD